MKKIYSTFFIFAALFIGIKANAQCGGCTTTISTSDAMPHLVTSGTVLCVTATGSMSGLIEVDAGGRICNQGTITSSNIWLNGGQIDNYGTITTPDILTSTSAGVFNNYGTLTTTHFEVQTGSNFQNHGMANIDSLLVTDPGSNFNNNANLTGIRLAFVDATGNNDGNITEDFMGDSSSTFSNFGNLTINYDFGNGYGSYFSNISGGYMKVMRDFGNSTSSSFLTDCMITVGRDWLNSATINGSLSTCGGFNVASNSLNSGTIGSSTMMLDICDAGHPTGGLDGNIGTIGSATTFCSCTNNCISTVGILEPIAQSDLLISNVYPNPAVSTMAVELNANKPQTVMVEVYDMMGRKHSSVNLKLNNGTNKTSVDVSSLAQGTYVLKITDEQQLRTEKLFTVVK